MTQVALAVVLAAAGIVVSFLVGRSARRKPQLRYAIYQERVLEPSDWLAREGLSLSFKGKQVARLERTYIALWNHRGDTVRQADIVEHDPLRVAFDDPAEVLQVRVLRSIRDATQVAATVRPDRAEVLVAFDFLDSRDGALIEILHAERSAAHLVGTVRGAALRELARPGDFWVEGRYRATKRAKEPKGRFGRAAIRYLDRRASFPGATLGWGVVTVAAVLAILAVVFATTSRDPGAVDASLFDLTTRNGQLGFAHAVTGADSFAASVGWKSAVVLSLTYFLTGSWMLRMSRVAPKGMPRQLSRISDGPADGVTEVPPR